MGAVFRYERHGAAIIAKSYVVHVHVQLGRGDGVVYHEYDFVEANAVQALLTFFQNFLNHVGFSFYSWLCISVTRKDGPCLVDGPSES